MKLKEEHVHLLFIRVISKGIDGLLETIAGAALLFISTPSLRNLVDWLTRGELQEDPTDFVANHLGVFFHRLSINTKHFASTYLLTCGTSKVGLVAGLLAGKLWTYPAALGVLGLFLCYQVYRFTHNHSVGLAFLSLLDFIIVAFIWREYRYLKARRIRA
jgi:uncharacterized membrane protein